MISGQNDARSVPQELANRLRESGRTFIFADDYIDRVLDYRKQGYSYREIARLCNISKSYACYICKTYGGN